MDVEVLVADTGKEGSKSVFDAQPAARMITRESVEHLSQSFKNFCEAFSIGLCQIKDEIGGLSIDEIEMNVELTLKGEVRLIAAASAETKGSVKLVFRRRP